MVKPERRTRADLLAAAAIVVVLAVAAAVIWWTSDARATISRPAPVPAPNPTPARAVPASLKQLWTATSTATAQPVVVAGTVVTGNDRAVDGRDPVNGEVRWSYARDSDLCGVSWVYRYAVAVYRDDRGCGQVSTIDGSTGLRGPARSSYADKHVVLSSDATTVLSAGDTRLELWRSDMVRMLSYGEIDARVKPSSQGLHSGCRLMSAAGGSAAVSVLEACGKQANLRLSLLRPSKDEDEPEQRDVPEPGIGVDSGARVLAVAQTNTAVYLPVPQPRVDVLDETGGTVASMLLPKPP
ncbi:MAG: Rv3212 family protein, partial [Mycobacterium sp.]